MAISKHSASDGQIVWIKAKGGKILGKIVKINRVNIKVQAENGAMYTADPYFLYETSAAEAAKWSPGATATGGGILHSGEVVKFKNRRSGSLYVVIGQHSGAYRVAKLGGDGGRYIRNVQSTSVEVVTFDLAGV